MKKACVTLSFLILMLVAFGQSPEIQGVKKQSNNKKMDYEAKLSELKLQLPPVSAPKGLYRPLVIVGNIAYLSGHVSSRPDGTLIQGKVGAPNIRWTKANKLHAMSDWLCLPRCDTNSAR